MTSQTRARVESRTPRISVSTLANVIPPIVQVDVIRAMGALAQQTRLDIFRLLVQRGPDGVCAGDLANLIGTAAPTLSFHLSQLKNAGLIRFRREGRSLFYSANFEAIESLISYLTENCCGGRFELCAISHTPKPAITRVKRPTGRNSPRARSS